MSIRNLLLTILYSLTQIVCCQMGIGQVNTLNKTDSTNSIDVSNEVNQNDDLTLSIKLDTIPSDSISLDSLLQGTDSLNNTSKWSISPDSPEDIIEYGARDSIILDNITSQVYLYGQAYVRYGQLSLEAYYIVLDLNKNLAIAEGRVDSIGNLVDIPNFVDGSQSFKSNKMKYNFKSKKGMIYDLRTEQNDLNILGSKTKFYGVNELEGTVNNTIYSSDVLLTTCKHFPPHFGVRSNKQKVIQNKVAVLGTSNLEIGGVPTPLWLPFGFFPLKTGSTGGLMFPNNYQYSDQWGFGFTNIGYFVPISDHFDLTLLTDIYFRGSYGLKGEINFKKRYKYQGNINIGYSSYRNENVVQDTNFLGEVISRLNTSRDNSFSFSVIHNQDVAANPYRKIGGAINIQSNRYNGLNSNDATNVLNNTLSSNFSISQVFPGTPFSVSLGLTHSQNNQSRQIQMSLPRLDIQMKQINPFRKKNRIGPEKWYDKVSLGYSSSLRYDLNGVDTSFFTSETFDQAKFGMKHDFRSDVTFNLLKYFQLTPSISFSETFYNKRTESIFDFIPEISVDTIYNEDSSRFIIQKDTLNFGSVQTNRIDEFSAIHQFNAGLSLFTKIYGTIRLNKGWFRGLRHTLKPSISLNYAPNYRSESFDYYDSYEFIDNDGQPDENQYFKYSQEIFGGPSGDKQFAINYNLTNLFEAKFFSKKDSTTKKVELFDNFNISGNYNFAADSLNWSQVRMFTNLRLFKGVMQIKFDATYDPYIKNSEGQRINTLYSDVENGFLRFESAGFHLSTGMTIKQLRSVFAVKPSPAKKTNSQKNLWSLIDGLRLSYQFNLRSKNKDDGSHFFEPTINSVVLNGEIQLSPKWNLFISNLDYNFISKSSAYPDLSLSRDLHCWNMGVSWQPERNTYNFFIRVKPGSLDFINLPYDRNRADGFDNR